MKKILQEFKQFAMRGNVIDMAVGIIIGGAFGKIVSSVVADIIMPPIGMILGGVDFSNLFINLSSKKVDTLAEATAAKVPVIAYGKFITTVIDFLIMAFVIFLMISLLNRFKKEEKEENIIRGREMILADIKKKGYQPQDLLRPEWEEIVLVKYDFKIWDALLAAVGYGGMKEGQVVNRLKDEYLKEKRKTQTERK